MGRPLKQRLFGADANSNVKVQFHNGTVAGSVPGYIVKQVASRRFKCSDASGNTAVCKLVNKASGDLEAGEMSITVKTDTGTVYQVLKISSRLLTAENGVRYPWNFSTSTSDNAVQVEEAGNSTAEISADTGATDLEGDETD